MNAVVGFHHLGSSANRDVYWRLSVAGIGILAFAMSYCALHGFEYETFVFDPGVTLRWAVPRWGAWPVLLPGCYWLVQLLQRRGFVIPGLAAGAVAAILGTSVFAYVTETALGGNWTFFEAAYHMAPIAAGTFVLFVAVGLWRLQSSARGIADKAGGKPDETPVCLHVWKGRLQTAIDCRQIEWARAARNYVEFFVDGSSFIKRTSMAELERLLPADRFVRAHRSYLVNTRMVAGFEGGRSRPSLVMKSGSRLPVGRTYRHRVFEVLGSGSASS